MTQPFRQRQLAFREDAILRTGREVLDETGCRHLTMDAVAARLGISKGTLYRHFPSREELLRRVVGDAWGHLVEEMRDLEEEVPSEARNGAVARLLVRRLLGLDPQGDRPCCLEEVACPFLPPDRLESSVGPLDAPGVGGLSPHGALWALAASVQARRRAEGGAPTAADAEAIVRTILGER